MSMPAQLFGIRIGTCYCHLYVEVLLLWHLKGKSDCNHKLSTFLVVHYANSKKTIMWSNNFYSTCTFTLNNPKTKNSSHTLIKSIHSVNLY